VKGFFL